jgi:hypothetical protein
MGLVLKSEPVWYVQVDVYEKHLSFGVLVIHHTYYAKMLLIKLSSRYVKKSIKIDVTSKS